MRFLLVVLAAVVLVVVGVVGFVAAPSTEAFPQFQWYVSYQGDTPPPGATVGVNAQESHSTAVDWIQEIFCINCDSGYPYYAAHFAYNTRNYVGGTGMNVQDNKSYYSCVSYWVSGYGWQLKGCSSTYVAP